jgi:hypothetical protein
MSKEREIEIVDLLRNVIDDERLMGKNL